MKPLLIMLLPVLFASAASAQDVITLKTGETINGKVSEVGINEIKYYKATNLSGPVYVSSHFNIGFRSYGRHGRHH